MGRTCQVSNGAKAVDFVSEDDVQRAIQKGEKIYISARTIITRLPIDTTRLSKSKGKWKLNNNDRAGPQDSDLPAFGHAVFKDRKVVHLRSLRWSLIPTIHFAGRTNKDVDDCDDCGY